MTEEAPKKLRRHMPKVVFDHLTREHKTAAALAREIGGTRPGRVRATLEKIRRRNIVVEYDDGWARPGRPKTEA